MKWMEWLLQMWQRVGDLIACGGRKPTEMRYAGRDDGFSDSQLALPGIALQREWTYGKFRRG